MTETLKPEMGRTPDQEAELGNALYYSDTYFDYKLLASLCEQIVTIHRLKPASVLEIGKGNGFVSNFLRNAGIPITTFDINPNLNPDVVGNATKLTEYFADNEFDWVLCAEVLEHIPFEDAKRVLEQIGRVCKTGAVVTVPRCQRIIFDFQGLLMLPKMNRRRFNLNFFWSVPGKKISDCHHWEINSSPETRLRPLRRIMEQWFDIAKGSRSRLCPYHQFFTLKKRT